MHYNFCRSKYPPIAQSNTQPMSGSPPSRIENTIDFTDFADHRTRRRVRAIQSCLHCHTNKRKCDRKRPCQRCIQLGMTGLCIYEADDPDARHDPNVAETTKLQNRIAELEILVRELRGKPHPRWTSALAKRNMSELWHPRRHSQNQSSQKAHAYSNNPVSLQIPVKIEPNFAVEQMGDRHELFHSSVHLFGGFKQQSLSTWCSANFDSQASGATLSQSFNSPRSGMLPPDSISCACLANPSTSALVEFLASLIQEILNRLENLQEHTPSSRCPIYEKIIELSNVLCNALPRAAFNGHPDLTTSRDYALPSLAISHSLEGTPLWGSSHPNVGYSPFCYELTTIHSAADDKL